MFQLQRVASTMLVARMTPFSDIFLHLGLLFCLRADANYITGFNVLLPLPLPTKEYSNITSTNTNIETAQAYL